MVERKKRGEMLAGQFNFECLPKFASDGMCAAVVIVAPLLLFLFGLGKEGICVNKK